MSHDISSTGSIQRFTSRGENVAGLHGAEKCGTSLGAHGHRPGLHPAGPRKAAGEQGAKNGKDVWKTEEKWEL